MNFPTRATSTPPPLAFAVLRVFAREAAAGRPSPTWRELVDEVGASSTSTVTYYIDRLVRAGYLARGRAGKTRSVLVTTKGRAHCADLFPPTPAEVVLEAVHASRAAGEPLPARVVAALEAVA